MLVYTAAVRELPSQLVHALERSGRDLRILVVRLGAMGDIFRTLPAVRVLRRSLPLAQIRWLLESQWSVLLEGHPDLSGVISLPRRHWSECARSPQRWAELIGSVAEFRHRLRETRSDLSLDFHGNLRSALAITLAGVPVRLGYDGHQQKEGNRLFSTHRVAPGERRTPRLTRNLGLVRALGLDVTDPPACELPLVARGAATARGLVRSMSLTPGIFAVISPGASATQRYKTPPPELLAAACESLAGRRIRAVVVYGPGELPWARGVVDRAKGQATLAPPTDLPTLAALTADARLFIGGDSGPLHLACAVGCPVVGVYGPTDPRVNQPWGVPFRTVYPPGRTYSGIKREDRAHGFEGLEVAGLLQAVNDLLDETTPRDGTIRTQA